MVSVIVAARNEEKNIESILKDLVNQTYSRELYEVIIVNDGSEDSTGDIIDSFVNQYPLQSLVYLKSSARDFPSLKLL